MSETKSFKYRSYSPEIHTIHDVASFMQNLNEELIGTDLENLRSFNYTYLLITKAVIAKMNTSYFNNDAAMEKFDIVFAQYYFNALFEYVNNKEIAPAWKILFDASKNANLLSTQYMALGVNAHVNNDLPQSLRDMLKNDESDYIKINEVIAECIPEVLRSLKEKHSLVEFTKNRTIFIYAWFLKMMIISWRKHAWINYEKLNISKNTKTDIEKMAKKWANILSYSIIG